jgi:hypothetical protein
MENPIKKLIRKIRRDYIYVANFLTALDFVRMTFVPEEHIERKWKRRLSFIYLFLRRFLGLSDKIHKNN